jgi:hypothetical protein
MAKAYTYQVTHRASGLRYIGCRWKNIRLGIEAKDDLWVNYFTSSDLVKSMPRDEFDAEVLEEFDTKEEAWDAELALFKKYDVKRSCWYLNKNDRAAPPDATGTKRSPETRRKMSEAQKGNQNGLGGKSRTGQKFSEEQKRKMSEALKGNQNALGSKANSKPVVLLHLPSGMRVYFASGTQASRALGLSDNAVATHIYSGAKTIAKHYRAYYA